MRSAVGEFGAQWAQLMSMIGRRRSDIQIGMMAAVVIYGTMLAAVVLSIPWVMLRSARGQQDSFLTLAFMGALAVSLCALAVIVWMVALIVSALFAWIVKIPKPFGKAFGECFASFRRIAERTGAAALATLLASFVVVAFDSTPTIAGPSASLVDDFGALQLGTVVALAFVAVSYECVRVVESILLDVPPIFRWAAAGAVPAALAATLNRIVTIQEVHGNVLKHWLPAAIEPPGSEEVYDRREFIDLAMQGVPSVEAFHIWIWFGVLLSIRMVRCMRGSSARNVSTNSDRAMLAQY